MSTMDFLESLFQLRCEKLSSKEKLLLETMLFLCLLQELITHYEMTDKKEIYMIKGSVISAIVNDLLVNKEYTIDALANYTGYPEDAIYDLAAGINTNPTLSLSARVIGLHAIARRELYRELIKKVLNNFLGSKNIFD